MRRFTVHLVTGYRITPGQSYKQASHMTEGLTAYVMDEVTGAQVATYRSEDAPKWSFHRPSWALKQAREYTRGANANV